MVRATPTGRSRLGRNERHLSLQGQTRIRPERNSPQIALSHLGKLKCNVGEREFLPVGLEAELALPIDLPERTPDIVGERLDRLIRLACSVEVHRLDDLVSKLTAPLGHDLSRSLKRLLESALPFAAVSYGAERRLKTEAFSEPFRIR